MKKLSTLIFLTLWCFSLLAQSYDSPESAVYDPVNNQYLISNATGGTIVAADVNTHALSAFISSGLNSPKGMFVINSMLYVADVNKVHIINLSSGNISQSVTITDAQHLNDITGNSDTVFMTDMQASKIFYMTTNGASNGLISDSWSLDTPNGILLDANNDLIVVSFVSNSPLQKIQRTSGSVVFEMGTAISDMDGLTQDASGTYYLSSWNSDAVYHFSSVMSPPANSDKAVKTANDPADIYYDDQNDVLIVPLFTDNNVLFIDANTLGVDEPEQAEINAYPTPGKHTVYFNIPDKHVSPQNEMNVFTMDGKRLKSMPLDKTKMEISGLPAGTYIVKFKLENDVRTERIIISE